MPTRPSSSAADGCSAPTRRFARVTRSPTCSLTLSAMSVPPLVGYLKPYPGRDRSSIARGAAGVWWPIRSSKPAGRSSPPVGWFDSIAAPSLLGPDLAPVISAPTPGRDYELHERGRGRDGPEVRLPCRVELSTRGVDRRPAVARLP